MMCLELMPKYMLMINLEEGLQQQTHISHLNVA